MPDKGHSSPVVYAHAHVVPSGDNNMRHGACVCKLELSHCCRVYVHAGALQEVMYDLYVTDNLAPIPNIISRR